MTKRIFKTKDIKVLKQFISHRYNTVEELSDVELRDQIDKLAPGCFVLTVEMDNGMTEAVAIHKFKGALSTMITKENLISLHLRYLSKQERLDSQPHLKG